jgi:hypothetical protein
LADRIQRKEFAVGHRSGLFLEFTDGRGEGVFAIGDLSLGNRPRGFVFADPEGAARMSQQNFQTGRGAAEEQDTGTSIGSPRRM